MTIKRETQRLRAENSRFDPVTKEKCPKVSCDFIKVFIEENVFLKKNPNSGQILVFMKVNLNISTFYEIKALRIFLIFLNKRKQ